MANYDYILKIGGNADALFKEVVKKFSDAEKYVSGDEIEIKFNCDDSEIQQLIEEVQRLNPTIGTDVKLNFDQAEMRRQLTALNKYINKSMNAKSIAGDLQSELSESLNIKNIKGINFKEFLKEQTGGMKSATKNLARDYIMGMYGDIDKLDFSSGNVTYSQIVKTISKFEELVAYSERAKASFAKIELPDFSAELKQLYKDSSIYIEGNKDNLVGSLTDTYKEEIKKLKETVKKLGIKSDMFPVVEVDIVPDIDPAEFSKEIQDKLAGHSVEIKVKPVVDDDFSSSVSDAIDKKTESMSGVDHDKPNKPQNPNKPGDSVPIGVHPDFSPEEFVSDIQKQIDGKTIDVKVNGIFDGLVNNAGNNYAKVIEQWNDADKIMSSVGSIDDRKDRLGERGAFLNSETGYISNSYISDKLDEFSKKLREKIYSQLNEEVDSMIHSHPQGYRATPTPDDLESLKTWREKSDKKINKSFIKGYSEIGVLNISGIEDDLWDTIISEYTSEIAKVDAKSPAQRLKEASGAKDWKDATNTLYKNALSKILSDKGVSGAFYTVPIEDFIKQNRSKGNTEIEVDVKPNIKSDDITREIGEAIDTASGTPEVRIDKEDISSKIEDAINDVKIDRTNVSKRETQKNDSVDVVNSEISEGASFRDLLNKDFSAKNKSTLEKQLRDAFKTYKPFFENGDQTRLSEAGTKAGYVYYKAFKEASGKLSEDKLTKYSLEKSGLGFSGYLYNHTNESNDVVDELLDTYTFRMNAFADVVDEVNEKFGDIDLHFDANKTLEGFGSDFMTITNEIESYVEAKERLNDAEHEMSIDSDGNILGADEKEIDLLKKRVENAKEGVLDVADLVKTINEQKKQISKSSNVETVGDVGDSFVDEVLDESLPNTHDKPNEPKIPVVPDMTGFIEEISSAIIDPIPVPIKPDGINEFVNEIQESVMYSDKIRVRITSDPADSDSLIDKLANIKKYGKEFSDVFSSGAYGNAELLDNNQSLQKYIDLLRSLRDEDLIRIGFDVEELDNIKSIFSYIDNNMDEYRRLMNGESIIGADAIDGDLGSELLRLQNIFERIDKLDISGTLSSSLKDLTQENGSLVSLSQNLTDIIQKVDKKTEAFEIEGQTVSGIAQSESTDLAAIDGWIDVLIKDINALKESIESLPKIDIQLKNGDSTDKLSIEYLAGIDQLKKIISDFDLNNLKIVTDAINSLKVEDSVGENLQRFANAFLTFKSNLNNFNQNSKEALSSINELLSKADELKNLATILSFSKTDIDNVINIPEVSETKEASKDVSSTPVDANEIKNAADAYAYLSENASKYYSLIENRRQGKKLSDDDISFFEKYEQCFIDAANSTGVFADASEDAAQKAKEAYEKSIDSAKESAKALSMESIRKAFDKLPLENKTPQYIEYVDDIKSKIEELESLLPIDSLTSKDEINKINRLNDEINEMLVKASKKSPDFDLASSMSKTNLNSSISKWMRDNQKAASKFGSELEELRLKLSDSYLSASGLNEVREGFVKIKAAAADLNLLGKTFGEGLVARFKSLGQYLLSFASFYDVVDILRQGSQILVDINTQQTELAKVAEASTTRLQQSFENSISTAEDLKSSISDVISATADWSRSGYSIGDSEVLSEASVLYKNVGDGLNIEDASKSLVSTLQGFQLDASEAIGIVDKFNEVANNMPIDSAGIGEALQRSAASFHVAGTDLSEAISLIVGSNSVLQDPTRVGNMWKTVSARIRGAKTELEEAGEETDGMVESTSQLRGLIKSMTGFDIMENENTFKNMKDIIVGIGKEWDKLSDIDQAALLEKLAGKTQANALAAALENYELIEEAYQIAENSEGSALREQEEWEKSLEAKINGFTVALQRLATTTMDSDFLGGLIETGTAFINILNELIEKVGVLTPLLGVLGGAFATKNGFGKQNVVYNAPFYKIA